MKPKFITFEGGEGSGKSTQVKLLGEFLKSQGKDVIITREPGGTESAEIIRKLLVEERSDKWHPISELLLYITARNEHIEKLIKPALDAGKYVICDRFTDSTVAYQGYGHGLSLDLLHKLNELTIGHLQPDLTFILDIEVADGIKRSMNRPNTETRYESMDKSFHERVRQGFLDIAKHSKTRCLIINAKQDKDHIAEIIHSQL